MPGFTLRNTGVVLFLCQVSLTSPVVLKTLIPLCLTHLTSFMSFGTSLSDWLEVRETRVNVRKETLGIQKGMDLGPSKKCPNVLAE